MNEEFTWRSADIQRVNNYLIIKGDELFNSSRDSDDIYRACYALPSDPKMMDDWIYKHLDDNQAKVLYDFLF